MGKGSSNLFVDSSCGHDVGVKRRRNSTDDIDQLAAIAKNTDGLPSTQPQPSVKDFWERTRAAWAVTKTERDTLDDDAPPPSAASTLVREPSTPTVTESSPSPLSARLHSAMSEHTDGSLDGATLTPFS